MKKKRKKSHGELVVGNREERSKRRWAEEQSGQRSDRGLGSPHVAASFFLVCFPSWKSTIDWMISGFQICCCFEWTPHRNDYHSIFDRLDHSLQLWITLRLRPVSRPFQKDLWLVESQQSSGSFSFSFLDFFFFWGILNFWYYYYYYYCWCCCRILGLRADLLRAWGFLHSQTLSSYSGVWLQGIWFFFFLITVEEIRTNWTRHGIFCTPNLLVVSYGKWKVLVFCASWFGGIQLFAELEKEEKSICLFPKQIFGLDCAFYPQMQLFLLGFFLWECS